MTMKEQYETGEWVCVNQDPIDYTYQVGTVDWRGSNDSYTLISKNINTS